ncbi:MAG TPA: prenyltransferase/squalene oxidase repeat-containing protein [Solirubrobacterales bacterium]|jgi:energy-coupling factor transport system substrate-specific component|nr:prenyltransferase/squalene oxidase repeat-containing protein [Solirubrobacterales bacterium]
MSWELTSFLILGAVLLGGFAWYERSRPPSQVVALVAALAALAIAGRIAFAAFPNVKPTTDIVIFAGYALGGAPGFAVGALAALVSNFWFGQGPWTPWQMAGWGLCGILGAALALGGRNAGRLGLAATCGFAGIAYGALLNFSLMATYGGDLSLERFGVLEGRAIPFDLAHAAGNVALALIAGPAMVRMLGRFRERFEWGRGDRPAAPPVGGGALGPGLRGGGLAALLLVTFVFGGLAPTRAEASDVSRGADWLVSVQNKDGGFGSSPGDESGAEMTGWTMLGLEAAGRNPLDVSGGGHTPVDFLRSAVDELKSPGDLARTIVALEGAGVDPRHFAGANLVSELLAKRRDNGSYEGWPNSTAFAVIALRAADASGSLEKSLSWLNKVQNDDGGWGDVPGSPSTADGTGAVMQALSRDSKAVQRGLSYLRQAQRPGGGFPLGGNSAINTQSTAWAIQGILAAGANPSSFRRGGASAPDYLANQQQSDGHYRYSGSSNQTPIWVTAEVLVAAAGDYLPVPPPPREPTPSPSSAETGGISPGATNPSPSSSGSSAGLPNAPGVSPASPTAPANGGGGPLPNVLRPPGQSTPGAPAGTAPPAGRESEGSATSATATSESGASTDDSSDSSPLGAVALGLLAGALLFAAALGARRLWMHQRYGL